MPSSGVTKAAPIWLAMAVLVLIATVIVVLMPTMVGMGLALWLISSVPIGIAVGHLTLNRED